MWASRICGTVKPFLPLRSLDLACGVWRCHHRNPRTGQCSSLQNLNTEELDKEVAALLVWTQLNILSVSSQPPAFLGSICVFPWKPVNIVCLQHSFLLGSLRPLPCFVLTWSCVFVAEMSLQRHMAHIQQIPRPCAPRGHVQNEQTCFRAPAGWWAAEFFFISSQKWFPVRALICWMWVSFWEAPDLGRKIPVLKIYLMNSRIFVVAECEWQSSGVMLW